MAMRQFDVLDNPIPRARRALPFVAILAVGSCRHRPRSGGRAARPERRDAEARRPPDPARPGGDYDHALLVPSLTALPVTDLRHAVASLADDRERILAALDYLFIGF